MGLSWQQVGADLARHLTAGSLGDQLDAIDARGDTEAMVVAQIPDRRSGAGTSRGAPGRIADQRADRPAIGSDHHASIRILGERPIAELPHWYQRVSIYAFTSRNEGFGLTLIEASAAGAALVATRAGAAETVVIDGETGVLVNQTGWEQVLEE